jgi:hypothetical protein
VRRAQRGKRGRQSQQAIPLNNNSNSYAD